MEFKISGINQTGVDVQVTTQFNASCHAELDEESLAEAVIFFWKTLTMLQLYKSTKVAEQVAETMKKPGEAAVEEAVGNTRNIIIGKSVETGPDTIPF